MAITFGIKAIEVYGDSLLVINQSTNDWDVKEKKLKHYVIHL